MKVIVCSGAGEPNVLELMEREIPSSEAGWVVIKVKAFGLNRSEMFTRQGHSPDVTFPKVLGIECVGEIEDDPSGKYDKGQQVAAIMGGMGRDFDGAYTSFCKVPISIVFPFESSLPWHILGAIPEMFQTVSGSLQRVHFKFSLSCLLNN